MTKIGLELWKNFLEFFENPEKKPCRAYYLVTISTSEKDVPFAWTPPLPLSPFVPIWLTPSAPPDLGRPFWMPPYNFDEIS